MPVYRDTIRKGNTIIVCKDVTNGEIVEAYFVKRGLKKSKATTYEQIQAIDLDKIDRSQENPGIGLSDKCLQQIVDHLKGGKHCTVDLVKETKKNGMKALIGYDDFTCCWVIGTERMTIAVYKEDDIEMYTDSALHEVKQAAYCFLDILREFSAKELDQLKNDLKGFTLVGEYFGDYTIQHTVRYNREGLVFYAQVPNDQNVLCYPPENTINLLKKHGLPFSKYEICRNLKSTSDVLEALCDLANHIEQATLQESEEGAIIFIVLQREMQQKILVTSKIKTLEYRIYKQLRLRVFEHIDLSKEPRDQYELFNEEIYDIIKNADLHHSVNYYLNIADTAFRFCYEYPDYQTFVKEQFVSFLSLIINSMHESYRLTPAVIKDRKKLKAIEGKNWYSYSMGTLNLRNLDTRRHQKPMKKEPEMYVKKSPTPASSRKPEAIMSPSKPNHQPEDSELYRRKSSNRQPQEFASPQKTITKEDLIDLNFAVLMPVGIAGMGVSHFITSLCSALDAAPVNVRTKIVDADAIRVKVLDDLKGNKDKLGIEEYLNVSTDKYKEKLEIETISAIKELKAHKSGLNLVVIKKHYNTLQAEEFIAVIKSRTVGSVKFFCVTLSTAREEPNISLQVKANQVSVPFNHYMLLTCLKRKYYLTQVSKPDQKDLNIFVEQVLCQASKFANKQLSAASAKEIGFDGFIGFPFTNIQNEDNFMQEAYYQQTIDSLDRVLVSFLGKIEPTPDNVRELKVQIENFKVGAEWWQLDESDGLHSQYHHFIMKAISSLLKKYKTIAEPLLGASPANLQASLAPTVDSEGNPVIPLNIDEAEVLKNMEIENTIESRQVPIRNQNSVGKRRKPTEIGIYSGLNNDMMQNLFKNLAIDSLNRLEAFDPEVATDKSNIDEKKNWKFDDDFHITLLYIGGKYLTKEQDSIYNAFEADKEFPFLVHGMIYVPGVVIVGVTKLNRDLVMIEDKFDHLTIMSTKPGDKKLGKSVVDQVFSHDDLRDHWQSKLNKMIQVGVCKVTVDGQAKRAYLVPFRKKVLVQATTQSK